MFDLETLAKWDAALKRIETAPAPLLKDLLRQVMDVRQSRLAGERQQESRAA